MKRLKFLETKRTPRYSLRKFSVGVASVLLGVTIFGINFTNHSVKAATIESVKTSNSSPETQGSASNNATANNSTEAAPTSQSSPETQGSADTDIKSSTAKSAATNLVTISGTDRNTAARLAAKNLLAMNLLAIPDTDGNAAGTVDQNNINTQLAKENQELANKTNLTSSDNYSSNIYKGTDKNYYKIVTIYGNDYVYHAADIQANGTAGGQGATTAEDTKNNISTRGAS